MKLQYLSFWNEKIQVLADNIANLVECDGKVFNVNYEKGYYMITSSDKTYGLKFSPNDLKSMRFYIKGMYYNLSLNMKKDTLKDLKKAMYSNDKFLEHRSKFEWLITVVMYHFYLEKKKDQDLTKGA